MLGVAAAAGAVAAQAPSAPQKGPPWAPPDGAPLAVVRGLDGAGPVLTRLDAAVLEPRGKRLALGRSVTAWAYEPASRKLAVGSDMARLRFVDVEHMRMLAEVAVAERGRVSFLAWLWPNRVLVVYSLPGGAARVAWVDPDARRVIRQQSLSTLPRTYARGWNMVAGLLPTQRSIGGARIAIADAAGRLRVVGVPRIQVGYERSERGFRRVAPALALDPVGRSVYLVGARGIVARIELSSLAVSYHSAAGRRALAATLVPAAQTKEVEGSDLRGLWLGNHTLAVTGSTSHVSRTAGGPRQTIAPVGLRLIDTRTWAQRMLDPRASGFAANGSTLLAFGLGAEWGSGKTTYHGMGVAAFGLDGTSRFAALGEDVIWSLQAGSTHAYAWRLGANSSRRVAVVDLESGELARDLVLAHQTRLLLPESSSGY